MFQNSRRSPIVLPLLAMLALSACQSLQKSRVSVDYYRISGNSTAALDREIKRKGPRVNGGRHAVAVARIRIVPGLTFTTGVRNCRITRAKVSVDARVTLPRWTGRPGASKKLAAAWDNIDRYTRLHEAVHVAIAFRFAKDMENKLLALKPTPGCDQLKAKAGKIIDAHLKDHDKTQKKFDADEQKRFVALANRKRKKAS